MSHYVRSAVLMHSGVISLLEPSRGQGADRSRRDNALSKHAFAGSWHFLWDKLDVQICTRRENGP